MHKIVDFSSLLDKRKWKKQLKFSSFLTKYCKGFKEDAVKLYITKKCKWFVSWRKNHSSFYVTEQEVQLCAGRFMQAECQVAYGQALAASEEITAEFF